MVRGDRKRKPPPIQYGGKRNRRGAPFDLYAPLVASRPSSSSSSSPSRSSPLRMSWLPSSDKIDKTQTPIAPSNRPTSQKAATMPSEPEDGQVSMLMDFTGLGRKEAVRYLKAKSNDVAAAASAFFDGEDISKTEQSTQWDEGVWGAGKDGEYGNEHLHPLGSSAAATRPNSPAPSAGRANLHPTSQQQEEEDFAHAMAMSQSDVGAAYQQETGRIGANGQQVFGPANRESYDKSQWAMVPVGVHNTSEIVPDAEVEQRIHTPGEPRSLKHLPSGDYTPSLLMICHAISGARETMLMRGNVQPGYGQDADWWRGHPISLPRVVNVDDGSSAHPDMDKYDDLLSEVQRLMAFLSASDRSYASIGALTQNEVFNGTDLNRTPSRTLLELFLQQWTIAASDKLSRESNIASLFSTTIGTTASDGITTPAMCLVNMQVNIPQDSKSDLLEQLDDLLWDTKGNNPAASENYIERPAEVLVMRACQQNATLNPQLRLEIPAEFHIDKYLPENIEATRATRAQMAEGRKRIAKIEEIEKKLMTWPHPTKPSHKIETRTLLQHTLGHFSGQNRQEVINAGGNNLAPVTTTSSSEDADQPPHYQQIANKLNKVIASIDAKLLTLTEEKEKTRKAIADMSKAPPSGLRQEDLKHRYTLRGVATKPNITYVLCPINPSAAPEPQAEELLDDDTTPPGMRWWRIEYDVAGSLARISKTKSADYDVLRAVELESHSALLVYASDRIANTTEGQPESSVLPFPLAMFVQKDNALFASELQEERNRPPAYDFRPRADSAGGQEMDELRFDNLGGRRRSMDSTRVEGAGSSASDLSMGGHEEEEGVRPEFEREEGVFEAKQGYRFDRLGGAGDVGREDEVHEILLDSSEEEDEGVGMGERRGVGLGPAGGTWDFDAQRRGEKGAEGSSDTLMRDGEEAGSSNTHV